MVKLIACDIDGTLLKAGEKEISPEVLKQLRRLHERGVVFCFASGRQYRSLRILAQEYEDRFYYMCSNGAIIYGPYSGGDISADVISKTPLPRDAAEEMCRYILARDGLDLNVAGANMDYICPQTTDLTEHLTGIGYNVIKISQLSEIKEDILKVTACCPDGAENYVKEFGGRWGERFNVAVSGMRWLDITASDKGTGVTALCKKLGIPLSDVMAIGDNYNDLPMLDIVGHPVIMESAALELRARYPKACPSVEAVLAEL